MEKNKLVWCTKLKDGLKFVEPNDILADSYLNESKSSLERAEKNFKDGDLLWSTVVTYYAEYYSLYAFLQKIGIKCENHFCSILVISQLLGEEKINCINLHKDKRISAQYYMRIDKEQEVKKMLQDAKTFVSSFDELVSNTTNEEINNYRKVLKKLIA